MGTIEKELEDGLRIAQEKGKDDSSIKRFQSIQSDFESLVAKGYVKKRGNNSLSVLDAHLKPKTSFNSK
jgi:hypothetical protein